MYGPVCDKCDGRLSKIELDPTHFYYWCPDCDIEYPEDQITWRAYHVEEVSMEMEPDDSLLVRLEHGKLYIGINRTPEGYVLDVHNGSQLLKDPDGNDLTMTIWEDDWNSGEDEEDN